MKTACIFHGIDLDGWMSAAIIKRWWLQNYKEFETSEFETSIRGIKNMIDFIGYNYGQSIPDLSGYDKVVMVDISLPKEEMLNLFSKNTKDDKRFIWIDHHKSAIELYHKPGVDYFIHGLLDVKFAACELTWQYLFPGESMPEIVRLLGRYDCFGHKGTAEELKVLEFQYGARSVITDVVSAYIWLGSSIKFPAADIEAIHKSGQSIYDYLCTEAKQVYKTGFEIELIESPMKSHYDTHMGGNVIDELPVTCKFICINKERFNPINFGIDYHADGYDGCACFHYADGMWKFSLYNDNGQVDCSKIAKQYGGGGHKGASGFVTKDIFQIIKK